MGFYLDWKEPGFVVDVTSPEYREEGELQYMKPDVGLKRVLEYLENTFGCFDFSKPEILEIRTRNIRDRFDIYPFEFEGFLEFLQDFYVETTTKSKSELSSRKILSLITSVLIECGHAIIVNNSWKKASLVQFERKSYTNLMRYIALTHLLISRNGDAKKMEEFQKIMSFIHPSLKFNDILGLEQKIMIEINNDLDNTITLAEVLEHKFHRR